MYSPTALSLALIVAIVAPVLSVPVVSQPSLAPLMPAGLGIVPEPFADIATQSALEEAPVLTHVAQSIYEGPEGLSEHEKRQLGELLEGLLARSSPSPEPTHFCLMIDPYKGKACDTAQCKSGGGSCILNPKTNKCNQSNMRGKGAPIACLGCECKLEKS